MKSLVPWICLLTATLNQQVCANNYSDYRLGHYGKAASALLSQSTNQDALSNYYLGRMYLYGYGQLKNTSQAFRYFNLAAQKGYLPAIQLLARYELIYEKNLPQALVWFKKAAASGDVDAQLYCAAAYMYGLGEKKNKDLARKYFIEAAKNRNAIAQYNLAEHFLSGTNASNNKLGLIWLNKAAANNNPKALTKLAMFYFYGKFFDKNFEKATLLLNQAIQQAYSPAMVAMGQLLLAQNKKEEALKWFEQAVNSNNNQAYLDLAEVYSQKDSIIYDPKAAFMWTLKAAQNESNEAKHQLAQLFKKGVGVEIDLNLAQQWENQSLEEDKSPNQIKAQTAAALWLTNGASATFEHSFYQLNGIISNWQNKEALADFTYNQAPKFKTLSRKALFKPQFSLVQPNDISIITFYEALLTGDGSSAANQWSFPQYPLNKQVADLENSTSLIIAHEYMPAPFIEASYPQLEQSYNSFDQWAEPAEQLNYLAAFYSLYNRAILGDAQAQFEIGQMFQYGIGVAQNDDSATVFYQNAVQQQHLGAEYNLAILHLMHASKDAEYQTALNDLTDAAFKGNKYSQYVLARLLEKGVTGSDGVQYIKSNPEQASSMLYLAAANGYGPAEYELANQIARQTETHLNSAAKQLKVVLLRTLYQDAVSRGVSNARLPLAFYQAISNDKKKQQLAFATATEQAISGDKYAALLLGLMYDRGIGIAVDFEKALHWYHQSGQNAVAQFILGTYAALGKGTQENKEQAMTQLQLSATDNFSYADFNLAVLLKENNQDFLSDLTHAYELGNSHAGIVLADYYLSHNTDSAQLQQAKKIYDVLAAKGDMNAQLKLAYMNEYGLGTPKDLEEALRLYTASAEQENHTAEYLLGQFYDLGKNGEPNYIQAKNWYQKALIEIPDASVALGFMNETVDDNYPNALKDYEYAVKSGNPIAAYNLGLMYLYGKGVAINYPKAHELFVQAADQQVHEAMFQLGDMYFKGQGQSRDEHKALIWFKKAADLGNVDALYELGLFSETGLVSNVDHVQALSFYQTASDKENDKATLALARMYQYGLGTEKDLNKAVVFYEKLALKHNAYAQYQLGRYYLESGSGAGILDKAKLLLNQASDNGNIQARQILQRLEAKTQSKISFIEPLIMNQIPAIAGEQAKLIYFDALNEWNRGDELGSRKILHHLVNQFPDFIPAQQVYKLVTLPKIANG